MSRVEISSFALFVVWGIWLLAYAGTDHTVSPMLWIAVGFTACYALAFVHIRLS